MGDVSLNYFNQKEAADEVKVSVEANGRECLIFKADISQEKEVNSMVKNIIDRWGHITGEILNVNGGSVLCG